MRDEIGRAIRERLVVTFWYDGHERVVMPAALGLTTTGKLSLRGYQTAGTCKQGSIAQWKLFTVSKITRLSAGSFGLVRVVRQTFWHRG